jgi:peptidyl-prolyl cis-trans isomerase-like protein 2
MKNYLKAEKEIVELLYENKLPMNEIKSKINILSNCFLYNLKKNENWKKYFHNNKSRILSNGKMALSLTSTQMELNTISSQLIPNDDELRTIYYNIVKSLQKKAFVKLSTNLGDLNLEIFCNYAPMASENFIELCSKGLYNNNKFHRLIRNFIIQGGDIKENNIFGHNFKDEFNNKYSHNQKGILSMANSGSNTNNTQFFFTLENNKGNHLDNKHTIFGRVVGGIQTLDLINHVKVNKFTNDVPLTDIIIINTEVYNNPFREAIRDILWKEIKEKYGVLKNNNDDKNEKFEIYFKKIIKDEKDCNSVGKYLNKKRLIDKSDDDYQKKIAKI